MLDGKKQADLDQAQALLKEALPSMWWAMFRGSLEAGFTHMESMDLVKTFVLGMGAAKIYPSPSDIDRAEE